jgi:hypothetical protein
MTEFGYALSSEEHRPSELVDNAGRAERAGFDFATISDHYHPWICDGLRKPRAEGARLPLTLLHLDHRGDGVMNMRRLARRRTPFARTARKRARGTRGAAHLTSPGNSHITLPPPDSMLPLRA